MYHSFKDEYIRLFLCMILPQRIYLTFIRIFYRCEYIRIFLPVIFSPPPLIVSVGGGADCIRIGTQEVILIFHKQISKNALQYIQMCIQLYEFWYIYIWTFIRTIFPPCNFWYANIFGYWFTQKISQYNCFFFKGGIYLLLTLLWEKE